MNKIWTGSVVLLLGVVLSGCSASDGGEDDPEITDSQVTSFMTTVQNRVPYMQGFTSKSDFRGLLEAICESFDGQQSYGNISETTGAYIRKPASSGTVDNVIAVAVAAACPDYLDQTNSGRR